MITRPSGKMTITDMKNTNYLKNANKLLSADQYGFRANDSCANQLLSIVHNINTAFNAYPPLKSRVFFLLLLLICCCFFLICPRLLIKYGIRDLFLDLSQCVFQMHYYNLLNVTWQIDSRVLYSMVRH